ncbi:hypothetical protein BDR07DRAFT_1373712 [Suillus spraguei]|nr:hypothetical protein BDR07DRAFT_1373712 [Suillus spraguei]
MKLVQIVYLTILSATSATASATAATPVMAAPRAEESFYCPHTSLCTSTPPSNCHDGTVPYYVEGYNCWACCCVYSSLEFVTCLSNLIKKLVKIEIATNSMVIARGLPRPARVDVEQLREDLNIGEEDSDMAEVRRVLNSGIVDLLLHGSIAHPLPGTDIPGGTPSTYQIPPDDDLAAANAQIHLELASSLGFPDANETQVKEGLSTPSSSKEISGSQI